MLEQIIQEHPEKYQPYDLLAQVLDDEGPIPPTRKESRRSKKRPLQK